MRRLETPTADDVQALDLLTKRGKHRKAVSARRADISLQYNTYHQAQGNPWLLPVTAAFNDIKPSLHSLYAKPPQNFEYIDALRRSTQGACPVCGGAAASTLDHYLPKEIFPQFSLYSRNLVPACHRCNHAKGQLYRGMNVGERGVHPYFDDFAAGQVLGALFAAPWQAPELTIVPLNVAGDELLAVQWQIDNIILRSGIESTLRGHWGQLVQNPRRALRLNEAPPDVAELVQLLSETAHAAAHMQMSRNDWSAVFYHGVATSHGAAAYVLSRF